MAANRAELVWARVNSVCASAPFDFIQAPSPFSFSQTPTGLIDRAFRIEMEEAGVIGGLSYTEDRTDLVHIWVARALASAPQDTYRSLLTDATSLTAAVVRDGAELGGDYDVPDDGRGKTLEHDRTNEFALLRLTLPVNYEAAL